MRVAFLSPCWPHDLVPNGIASYVAYVREGLVAAGVDARVLAFSVGDDVDDSGVTSVADAEVNMTRGQRLADRVFGRLSPQMVARAGMGLHAGTALQQLDRRSPLDLFEMEESFGAATLVQGYFRKPLVVRLHGPWCVVGPALGHARDHQFWLRCAVEYIAIRGASSVSSPSQDVLDRVRNFYRLELPNARVIPNPAPRVSEGNFWNEEGCEANSILFVGRFDRVKGADTLLRAFVRVATEHADAKLIFVGPDRGLMEGRKHIGFEAYVRQHVPDALQSRIHFKGVQTQAQIGEHRKRAALTVVSSRYETFCLAAVEAMATGAPLVAARAGGIAEIVVDGHTGLLFAPEDSNALASQIVKLLTDRALAGRLGQAAREDVEARFGGAALAEQTHAFYAETLARCERS